VVKTLTLINLIPALTFYIFPFNGMNLALQDKPHTAFIFLIGDAVTDDKNLFLKNRDLFQ